jgi:ADP-ribose pyrophosphatase
VLCVEQYRPAIGALSLEIPAGRRESGETSEENAARELLEETGYVAGQLTPLGRLHAVPCFSTWEAELYLACDARRSTRVELENDLPLRTVRVPLDDVERLIAEGRLTDGKTIAGLLLARSALR